MPRSSRRSSPLASPSFIITATGKRKTSVARIRLKPGTGMIRVNGRNLDEYFPRQYLRTVARHPNPGAPL